MPGVGIISSIDFQNTTQQAAFLVGANQPTNFYYRVIDKLGFTRNQIGQAISALVSDPKVTLIVTVGGLVTCHETILNNSKTPFISLIGYLPPAPFPQPSNASLFRGCVTLDTIAQNSARITWIGNAPWSIAPANIGLLYDPNTAMATQEAANWQSLGGGSAIAATNGAGNPESFSADFDALKKAGVAAVVISAAPAHYKHREQLIAAANASGFDICYPLKGYANIGGINLPVHNKAVTIGPDLDSSNPSAPGAYWQLGNMAQIILAGGSGTMIVTAGTSTVAL